MFCSFRSVSKTHHFVFCLSGKKVKEKTEDKKKKKCKEEKTGDEDDLDKKKPGNKIDKKKKDKKAKVRVGCAFLYVFFSRLVVARCNLVPQNRKSEWFIGNSIHLPWKQQEV